MSPAAFSDVARFAAKCRFDAATGCVIWEGGTTDGRGGSVRYGSFWYAGKRWLAHRWSAEYLLGMPVRQRLVGHCCPNSLCVQHIETAPSSLTESERRYYWLSVQKGFGQLNPAADQVIDDTPFFNEPEWLRPFIKETEHECPF